MKLLSTLAFFLLTTNLVAQEGEERRKLFADPKPTLLPADFYQLPPPPPPKIEEKVEEKPIIFKEPEKEEEEEKEPERILKPVVLEDEEQALLAQKARRRLAQRRARQEPLKVREAPLEPEPLYAKDLNYHTWDQRTREEKLTYPVDRDWVMTKEQTISGIVETEISSAIGGRVKILIDTDHFASKGWKVILPKGTRMFCEYQPLQNVSDSKLPLRCTEAIRPDGARLYFEGQGKDAMGREGLVGDINHRTLEKYGAAFSMSALATLADASSARMQSKNPMMQNGASQLSQNLGHVTAELIDQNLELAPVITIEAGSPVYIKPTTDIWLRPPLSRQEVEAMKTVETKNHQRRQQRQQQQNQPQNQQQNPPSFQQQEDW